jgi:phage protein D
MFTPNDSIADLKICINGVNLLPAALTDVRSVSVEEDMKAAGMFAIDLYNWDEKTLAYRWSDSYLFDVGNQVEIEMGYLNHLQKVITGEITSLEPSFQAGNLPTLTVRGYDLSHRLRQEPKTKSYKLVKDSDIARQIAAQAGLVPRVEDSKNRHDYVMQRNQTDMAFLQARAERIGFEVFVRHKELYFRPEITTRIPAFTLSLEKEITEFSPRLTVQEQVDKVVVKGWDVKEKKAIVARAGIGDERKMGSKTVSGPQKVRRALGRSRTMTINLPLTTKAEADQIARGQLQETALSFIEGNGSCYGRSWLHAGLLINIEGAGKTFSGAYMVTATTHTLNGSRGYRTNFSVRRNAA